MPGKAPLSTRSLHRIAGSAIAIFLLYFAVTGVLVQTVDLKALLSHAPATAPDMRAIRESIDGPANFAVIAPADYGAPALPANLELHAGLNRILATVHGLPLSYVELRVADGRPTWLARSGARLARVDAMTGAPLPVLPAVAVVPGPQPSAHDALKHWHRLWALGDWMLWLNALVGIALGVMLVTGLVIYAKLYAGRRRIGRTAPFWAAGGPWRSAHRGVAVIAALWLGVVAISGTLLSIDSLALQIYRATAAPEALIHGFPAGMTADESRPLPETAVPTMLDATLSGFRADEDQTPLKVIRLRYFAGMPQGVVVTGGAETRQRVFNAVTGARVSMTEPGYPYTGFPFGWREHELMKRIHRGDVFGMPGRVMDLLAGLALAYLSVSGLWIYLDLWRRRRKAGRSALVWK